MNQLHKGCNRRLKQQMVCTEHGNVERADIVKGYEYEKDRFVIVEEADLDSIKIETSKTIDIVQFIDATELDPIYLDAPYYVAPDGPMAADAFRIVREAMQRRGKVALARVVMNNREHTVSIAPFERGFRMTTLHSADELRSAEPYFEGIKDGTTPKDQLALAEQLIDGLSAPLDLSSFTDRYQDALLDMIKAKVAGTTPVVVPEAEVGQVINLMDALKQSLAKQSGQKKPPAASVKAVPAAARERKKKGA